MGFEADICADWEASLAALAWQLDCGIDEALGEAPVNRYEVVAEKPAPHASQPHQAVAKSQLRGGATLEESPPAPKADPVALAEAAAAAAGSLEALKAAVGAFPHCELKKGARNTLFAEGNPAARVMVLGEAPGREEDIAGRPFAGQVGHLFDRMFAAIGLARETPDAAKALYLSNVVFWKPTGDRAPDPADIAMLMPFTARHIALADPDVIVVMGSVALEALTGQRSVLRARGKWLKAYGKPVLPMLHPSMVMKSPEAKRDAWADLLALQAFLRGKG
ncbi:uracil-DNA glycosylase [Pseudogemmobacter faecipullorum]|uniref:Type-4 uracil-DNA glycosylase n=1 Tax=Pseudogemmobacter faecipullorum TaxID=2755041 RepID=A0ABS8CNL5_9RHOB|nr:uracil-DNA glycosylase [Pseudogemmobacter faecipullorum]MCB5410988.1 uracil-DNA glycosylase [Pseudogemmobacter faecipullorum]